MEMTVWQKIKDNFPEFRFVPGRRFKFQPPKTIFYEASLIGDINGSNAGEEGVSEGLEAVDDGDLEAVNDGDLEAVDDEDKREANRRVLRLLHELGHAVLKHRDFRTEVGRLKMEVMAWEKARELAERYGVAFDEELVQIELDSYRDWLHQKSRCPSCGLTRFQTSDKRWHCPNCEM